MGSAECDPCWAKHFLTVAASHSKEVSILDHDQEHKSN